MILTEKLTENQALLDEILPVGKSTDLLVRNFNFGGREGRLYYLDGFLNDIVMERLVAQLINLTPKAVNQATDMQDFVDRFITYTEVDIYTKTDDVITGTLTTTEEKNTVFTSIPYDAGWKVYVDGEETEIFCLLDTMLGFAVENPGEHEIELRYRPDCVKYGLILSASGLVIYALLFVLDVRKRRLSR